MVRDLGGGAVEVTVAMPVTGEFAAMLLPPDPSNWWGSAEPADSLFVGDVDRRDALTTGGGAAAR
jgi:hypothetical protein